MGLTPKGGPSLKARGEEAAAWPPMRRASWVLDSPSIVDASS